MRNLFKRRVVTSNFPNEGEISFEINIDKIKKVFILEDDADRLNFFLEIFKDRKVDFTKDVDYAKRCVGAKKYDLILLDHDMEDFDEHRDERLKGPERTGTEVAEHLRDTMNIETFCIIHSMNPRGAANMVKAHPFNTCYIPFFMLKEAFKTKEAI